MTNSSIISEVVNDVRAMQIDDRISERYVLSKLRSNLGLYLKRENDTLNLFYYDNIWTTIGCVKMEEVDNSVCLGATIPKVNKYMRSVDPIPEIYGYKNGPLVKEVMPIDEGTIYNPSSPNDFIKITKREFVGELRYYWFRNGHLIIPNGPTGVHFSACFVEQHKALALCACNPVLCADPMEDEFPCPAHLLSVVKQDTIKDLFNYYKRNILDEVGDADTNVKTEKPNAGSN